MCPSFSNERDFQKCFVWCHQLPVKSVMMVLPFLFSLLEWWEHASPLGGTSYCTHTYSNICANHIWFNYIIHSHRNKCTTETCPQSIFFEREHVCFDRTFFHCFVLFCRGWKEKEVQIEWRMKNEEWRMNNEQWTMNNKQWAMNNEQWRGNLMFDSREVNPSIKGERERDYVMGSCLIPSVWFAHRCRIPVIPVWFIDRSFKRMWAFIFERGSLRMDLDWMFWWRKESFQPVESEERVNGEMENEVSA